MKISVILEVGNCGIETLRQLVCDLEKELGEFQVHFFGYDKMEKELTAERAISDNLSNALKNVMHMYERQVDSSTVKLHARDALAELAAMRKGETA